MVSYPTRFARFVSKVLVIINQIRLLAIKAGGGMAEALTVVLDVGKTMAKLTLWSASGELVARETRPNERAEAAGHVALDAAGVEAWMADTLRGFTKLGPIKAIIPVGHGAAAAIVRDGKLAAPPIDYEEPIGDAERATYDAERDPFSVTGSPSLPDGLNLGAQLHVASLRFPDVLAHGAQILPWPQYWAWRLSGVAASEVTSLGCHTDLWNPVKAEPSRLASKRGWAEALPPLMPAASVLGTVTPEWQERSGLSASTQVHCGLHDSNAALLAARGFAEIADRESTVLSTGTWFVAMRTPQSGSIVDPGTLSEARDCLVNVDAYGRPVPSSRFMGGREIELLTGLDTRRIDIKPDQPALIAGVAAVLASGARVLPSFAPGFGPFPQHRGRWIDMPVDEAERRAAVSIYAALVADVSLDLIGAKKRILVEGRFAEAEVFIRSLAALRPGDVIYRANAHNDVSFGALRLLDPDLKPDVALERIEPLEGDFEAYRAQWQRDVARLGLAA
ncbi:carbohydrate kinase [Sphingomonas sp. MG17]|uniref:Carbohydrate kinase n=1 Tax=Sphingomonas tagetis TaxID=2949092 RepID=A0A9X2HJW4_9SPHN|nr:carbohydrate kinase [Sphingomonas tagetis]MCP3732233.1 carbohydrate kinase [Sphingomonas tagetis]